jgi:MoCo/4Fe-4S cofactor protein with predicted Tat translocation signal
MKMEEQNGKPHQEAVCPSKKDKLDLETVRARIAETKGPEFWRSLEELAGSTEFKEMMHREFPKGASEWLDDVSRRGFLKLMGASMALAGMTACTKQPLESIVPYVKQPEELVPGRPQFFATAFSLSGYASPVLVESHTYRPTKIEGNEQHPASLGGTDIFAQASILEMYDPDRSQNVIHNGELTTWGAFIEALEYPLKKQNAANGAGIRILTKTVSSPTLADQIHSVLGRYPQAKWHVYEPVNRDNVMEGAKLAFGEPVETQYKLANADVIVSLDADFLYAGFPGSVIYARDFAKRRNPDVGTMSRLYVVESNPSSTGAKADHRLPVRAVEVEGFARALASKLGAGAGGSTLNAEQQKYLSALAGVLQSH